MLTNRKLRAMLVMYFANGGVVTKCPPAFARGCEIPCSKRLAIRAGWGLSAPIFP